MSEFSTVARPYAQALFNTILDDKQDDFETSLAWIAECGQIAASKEVQVALAAPHLALDERIEFFSSLVKATLPDTALNFIRLLIENNRLLLFPEITRQFIALKDQHEAIAQANITSAFALSELQLNDLVATLELKFKLNLKPHVTIDPSLIGGVRVAVGDRVFDTSVQAQLACMRDTLVA